MFSFAAQRHRPRVIIPAFLSSLQTVLRKTRPCGPSPEDCFSLLTLHRYEAQVHRPFPWCGLLHRRQWRAGHACQPFLLRDSQEQALRTSLQHPPQAWPDSICTYSGCSAASEFFYFVVIQLQVSFHLIFVFIWKIAGSGNILSPREGDTGAFATCSATGGRLSGSLFQRSTTARRCPQASQQGFAGI